MTRRRTVASLYGDLSAAEAYSAFLAATARGDRETAEQIVGALPAHDLVLQRSDLMPWHEGFIDVVREFEREVQVALARSELASRAYEFATMQAEVTASMASEMYMCGVAVVSGEAGSESHLAKATEVSETVLAKSERVVAGWEEVMCAARQRAADLVHGLDATCQAVGIDPDVIIRSHTTIEIDVVADLRAIPRSSGAEVWLKCFIGMVLRRVG